MIAYGQPALRRNILRVKGKHLSGQEGRRMEVTDFVPNRNCIRMSMITFGHSRPNIPEYPQIADQIRQAIDEVYAGSKTSKEALDDAAEKSAKTLGW